MLAYMEETIFKYYFFISSLCCRRCRDDHPTYSVRSINKAISMNRPSSFFRFTHFRQQQKCKLQWNDVVSLSYIRSVALPNTCIFRFIFLVCCRYRQRSRTAVCHFTRSALFWFAIHIQHFYEIFSLAHAKPRLYIQRKLMSVWVWVCI